MAIHPLQSSGQISYGDVNEELGRPRTSQISLYSAENGGYATINAASPSKPTAGGSAAINEWYGYNHLVGPLTVYSYNFYSIGYAEYAEEACTLPHGSIYAGYSTSSVLGVGSKLYYNETLTDPFNGDASYYLGTNNIVYGVDLNTVFQVTPCGATSVTSNYNASGTASDWIFDIYVNGVLAVSHTGYSSDSFMGTFDCNVGDTIRVECGYVSGDTDVDIVAYSSGYWYDESTNSAVIVDNEVSGSVAPVVAITTFTMPIYLVDVTGICDDFY